MKNFYPTQYKNDEKYFINHNYLKDQFKDYEAIMKEIQEVILNTDFTLGRAVDEVEALIANEANTKFAIAVGSGTDALFLSLKALGVGAGDEVITTTYTFYATVGAIVTAGATPVFCDVLDDYNIDPKEIESKITSKTKAIIPVHWSGRPCMMKEIKEIAKNQNIYIIEDACHAIQAEYEQQKCGSLGTAGCFSFHPLKNLNVWGDGGIVTTNNEELSDKLRLIRNHGLINRNTCMEFAYNSRLDTIQAVVAKYVIKNKLNNITSSRIKNSLLLDEHLSSVEHLSLNTRNVNLKEVFHLYMFKAKSRDQLADFLKSNGVDAKIHYPIPMHLQPAAKYLNYKYGDFPKAEYLAENSISLPVHEYVNEVQIHRMIELIKDFYK